MFTVLTLLVSRVKQSQALRLVVIGVACLLVGAGAFAATQHVSYGTGVYWAITTATTVGYGDVVPKNTSGRVVAVLVMLTTIPLFASAFAMFAGTVAASHLRRLLGVVRHDTTADEVIVFGMHPTVPKIASTLLEAGRRVVVVADVERDSLPDAVHHIAADPTSEHAIRRSHPERAGQLLLTGASDADVLVTAVLIHQLAPDVPTVAVAQSPTVARALAELGIPATVSVDDLLASTLAKSLEAPHAGELLLRLIGSNGYQMSERPVTPEEVGQPLSAVRAGRASDTGLVLGAVHDNQIVLGVGRDPVLASGDHLLVVEAAPSGARGDHHQPAAPVP
jgi:voltage-gated potassium channel